MTKHDTEDAVGMMEEQSSKPLEEPPEGALSGDSRGGS